MLSSCEILLSFCSARGSDASVSLIETAEANAARRGGGRHSPNIQNFADIGVSCASDGEGQQCAAKLECDEHTSFPGFLIRSPARLNSSHDYQLGLVELCMPIAQLKIK